MTATVTVGIPFLNNEETLGHAIQSVLNQSCSDWRLLLIDDGSTDRSLEIAGSYKDSRIELLVDGQKRGLVQRLNQMVSLCKTPFFARMDSDDIMHPERLLTQLSQFARQPNLDIVSSGAWIINRRNQIVGERLGASRTILPSAALRNTPFLHPSVLGRTEWFRQHRYDDRYVRMEDGELWLRTLVAGELRYAVHVEPLMFYREPENIDPAKILASYRTRRMLIQERGPQLVGTLQTKKLLAFLSAKELVWQMAKLVPNRGWLLQARSQTVPAGKLETARKWLDRAVRDVTPAQRRAA